MKSMGNKKRNDTRRSVVYMSEARHRRVKILAASTGIKVQELVAEALDEGLPLIARRHGLNDNTVTL